MNSDCEEFGRGAPRDVNLIESAAEIAVSICI